MVNDHCNFSSFRQLKNLTYTIVCAMMEESKKHSSSTIRFFRYYPELEHIKISVHMLKASDEEKKKHYKTPLHALLQVKFFNIMQLTISRHDDNPYLYSGYRKMPVMSLSKCFWSAFTLHNDFANIWTHFIPALYFLYMIFTSYEEMGRLELHLEERIILIGYLIFASITMFLSAAYHTFRSHSESAYHFCLACDLRGIVLLLCGANMLCISQAMKYFQFWRQFYNILNFSVLLALSLWIPYMVKHRLGNQRTLYFAIYSFVALFVWTHRYFLLASHHHLLPRMYNYADHYESGLHHLYTIIICYFLAGLGLIVRNLKYPGKYSLCTEQLANK